jgi:peptidoglycan hydrolase CwlO-like protein
MGRYEVRTDGRGRPYICDTEAVNKLPLKTGAISLARAANRLNYHTSRKANKDLKRVLDELGKKMDEKNKRIKDLEAENKQLKAKLKVLDHEIERQVLKEHGIEYM